MSDFWQAAIERNRDALLRIVETLFALAGLDEGDASVTLPRRLHNYFLRVLRPAESAIRRLIVVAARDMPAPALSPRGRESDFDGRRKSRARGIGPLAFPLIDPRKRFDFAPRRRYARTFPRISIIGVTEPGPIPEIRIPSPDDPVDAARLCRRLRALRQALSDIDGQARRLVRLKARRDRAGKRLLPPMRPGWPPGYRRRPIYEIDGVLRDCHSLAVRAGRPDTS